VLHRRGHDVVFATPDGSPGGPWGAVGAICHGVLVAARRIDPATGASVLRGRRTTALTWQLGAGRGRRGGGGLSSC
jgi:hypothetical protein